MRTLMLDGYGSFVGREQVLLQFHDDIDRLKRKGPMSANLCDLYGPKGIGKSELLRQFADIAVKARVPHAYIDFAVLSTDEMIGDPSILYDEVVKQLGGVVDGRDYYKKRKSYLKTDRPTEVVSAYAGMDQETRLYQRPKWLEAMREQTVELIKVSNQLGQQREPQVIIFDNAQHVEVEAVDFIEEWMVNPLIQVPGLLAFWSDRKPWRWKRPEIRRRLQSTEIKSLTKDQTREWASTVAEGVAPAMINKLYQVSVGNPGALQLLAQGGYI